MARKVIYMANLSKVVDIRCRRYEIYAIKSFRWKDNPVTNESSNEKQYTC